MFTTLDPVSIARRKMDDLEIPNQTVAVLARTTPAQLSRHMAGIPSLDIHKWRHIETLLKELALLAQMADPVPINFRKVAQIERLLAAVREGRLKVRVEYQDEAQS